MWNVLQTSLEVYLSILPFFRNDGKIKGIETKRNLEAIFYSSITSTLVQKCTLLRARTDTPHAVTRIRARAAFGFHLVIPEHEQAVHAQSEGRVVSSQGLIRVVVAVAAHTVASFQLDAIKRAHGLAIQLARVL